MSVASVATDAALKVRRVRDALVVTAPLPGQPGREQFWVLHADGRRCCGERAALGHAGGGVVETAECFPAPVEEAISRYWAGCLAAAEAD
jgi:hypothetical protein